MQLAVERARALGVDGEGVSAREDLGGRVERGTGVAALAACTGTWPSEEKNQRDSEPFTPVPVKYSAFARNDTRRGTTIGITTLSMKLRWLAARMTGPSVGMFSRPSTTGR